MEDEEHQKHQNHKKITEIEPNIQPEALGNLVHDITKVSLLSETNHHCFKYSFGL